MRAGYGALRQAAAQVATPHLRNMGTLGGNLCLDTRCNYYNQNYEWRKAIDFCLKKDGDDLLGRDREQALRRACPRPTCAPALIALDAQGAARVGAGEREVAAADSIATTGSTTSRASPTRSSPRSGCPAPRAGSSSYWKLRRRGAFDFPVLGVAAAVRTAPDGTVEDARIVLGAVASRPFVTKGGEAARRQAS